MSRRAIIRVGPGDSTLRGRWLGARLRELRERRGLTGGQVGAEMDRSHSVISRWESGDVIPRKPELLFMLDLYDAQDTSRDELLGLYAAAREQRDASEVVSTAVADFDWLQRRASRLEDYKDLAIPGLLQTADYARAVIKAWDPDASPERIERTVATRIARQRRLTDENPLQLSAIVDESVLRRPVGGPEVMRAQLRHLVNRARLPNVELRVVPFAVGAHAGFPGPFVVLHFPDDRALVHLVTRGGDIYVEDVQPFVKTMRRLSRVALSARKSAVMIATCSREIA